MSVINHSGTREIVRHISTYILESVLIHVMSVINNSGTRKIIRHISAYIRESFLIHVMSVMNHSGVSEVWKYISTYILRRSLTTVICVIDHLLINVFWSDMCCYTVSSNDNSVISIILCIQFNLRNRWCLNHVACLYFHVIVVNVPIVKRRYDVWSRAFQVLLCVRLFSVVRILVTVNCLWLLE